MGNWTDRPIHGIRNVIALLCMAFSSLCYAQASLENTHAANAELPASAEMIEPAFSSRVLASVVPSSQSDVSLLIPSEQQQPQINNLLTENLSIDETRAEKQAMTAAVADGITTGLALSTGAVETNPVIGASPLGIVAATGMKFAILKYADSMPQEQKRFTLKTSSAVWGGAAVNNILVLLAAPPPAPLIAGLVMGFFTWMQMSNQYAEEDRIAAARDKALLPTTEEAVAALTSGAESSGQ
jgi:hypothetical protein